MPLFIERNFYYGQKFSILKKFELSIDFISRFWTHSLYLENSIYLRQ